MYKQKLFFAVLVDKKFQDRIISGKIKGVIIGGGCDVPSRGKIMLINPNTPFCIMANINYVKQVRVIDLEKDDYEICGYVSQEEVLKELQETFSPYINMYDVVGVIQWDNISGILVDNMTGETHRIEN